MRTYIYISWFLNDFAGQQIPLRLAEFSFVPTGNPSLLGIV